MMLPQKCHYIRHTPRLTMVKETHRTTSFFPSLQFLLWDPWGEKVRLGQRRKEGSSLSPIIIISMGAQNVLCQQNTNLLSREEHENERERWEEWKGRERYYHSILHGCDLYGTPYISLISRNAVNVAEPESKSLTFDEYKLPVSRCSSTTPDDVWSAQNNLQNWYNNNNSFLCPAVK